MQDEQAAAKQDDTADRNCQGVCKVGDQTQGGRNDPGTENSVDPGVHHQLARAGFDFAGLRGGNHIVRNKPMGISKNRHSSLQY